MTRLLNLTAHPVSVRAPDGSVLAEFPPHPQPARIREAFTPLAPIPYADTPLPLTRVAYHSTSTNLPAPQPETYLIVSRVLAAAYPHRSDLVFPLHEVRDPEGNIIGCRALGTFHVP